MSRPLFQARRVFCYPKKVTRQWPGKALGYEKLVTFEIGGKVKVSSEGKDGPFSLQGEVWWKRVRDLSSNKWHEERK